MHILIVKLSSLGDLFHALPAVHSLKIGLGAQIAWVVHDEYVDLAKCFIDADRIIPFYRKAFLTNLIPFLRELRSRKYDYIIDLQGLLKSAVVCRLARGKERIGPSFYREGARMFYSSIAGRRNAARHAVEQNLDVAAYFGIESGPPQFPVSFPKKNLAEQRPRAAIVPASRWLSKNWPAQYFVDMANLLLRTKNVSLFLLGGPADIEVCEQIERGIKGGAVNMAGKTTLVEMGSLLKEMDLLISNDSGPVHIAAAAGTPTLVVFGPTDPARTGPYGPGHRVVTDSLSCRPCFSRTCLLKDMPCLSNISPEKVAGIALEMLSAS